LESFLLLSLYNGGYLMRLATVFKIVGGVVVAAGVGAVAILMSIDVNQYKGEITAQVEKATGRKLEIDGDLSLSIGLQPAVVVNGVRFANAPWSKDPTMVSVDRFEAQVDLMAALSGQIQVERLVIIKPTIVLESKGGKVNWDLALPSGTAAAKDAAPSGQIASQGQGEQSADAAGQGGLTLPSLQAVELRDARLLYRDGDSGQEQVLTIEDFTAEADGLDSPLQIVLKGAYDSISFDLSGTVGALSLLSQSGGSYPVALAGTVAGTTLSVDGVVKDPLATPAVDMAVAFKADSLDGFKSLIGEPPRMPPLSVKTRLSGSGNDWSLQGMSLSAGNSTVTGDLSVALGGKRPALKMALQAALIDLQELLPQATAEAQQRNQKGLQSQESAAPTSAGGKVLPSDPLPLDGLKAADVVADIGISKIILPSGVEFEGLGLKAGLSNGVLKLSPLSARLGAGAVEVSGTVDGSSGKVLAVDLTLTANKVVLGTLFEQIKRPDLLTGSPTDATVRLKGQGASVAALAGSLNGSVLVKVGEGKIHNSLIDWAGADLVNQLTEQLDPFADKSPYTDLSCGVVNVKVSGGTASWDQQIAIQTSKMNVVSSGTTNMGAESLDVAVRPYAREGVGISAGKLAEMVRLQGSYAKPVVGVDAEGVVRNVGSLVGAIATGGTSLIAEALLDQSSYEPEPCKVALGEKAPSKAESKSSSSSPVQGVADKAKEAVQGVGGAIGDTLGKGLGGLLGR
jgi:uncharacterized protein involved in outer membrane biogenesis